MYYISKCIFPVPEMRNMARKRSLANLVEDLEDALNEKSDLKREHQQVFNQVSALNKRIKLAKDEILNELNEIGEESIEICNSVVSLKRTVKENHDANLLPDAVYELKETVQIKPRKKKQASE